MVAALLVVSACTGGDDQGDGDGAADSAQASSAAPPELPLTDLASADADTVLDGGSLRLATPVLPASFNPSQVDGARDRVDQLLAPTTGNAVVLTDDPDDSRGWRVDPDYATSVEVEQASPLRVRVELNPKARWGQDTPITSADARAYWQVMSGRVDGARVASTDGWADIADVVADGQFAYTVEFAQPRADWPLFVYPRLPQSISSSASTFNDGYSAKAVPANGPFQVATITPDQGTVELVRNPAWWGAAPKLESIIWRIAPADVARQAFDAGELDAFVPDLKVAGRVELPDDADMRVSAGGTLTELILNAGRGTLSDRRVRRAIALALDVDLMASDLGRAVGHQVPSADEILTPPSNPSATARDNRTNLDQAKEALRSAGAQNLTLRMPLIEGDDLMEAQAEQIRQDLAQIDVAVQFAPIARADFYTTVLVPLAFDIVLLDRAYPALGPASVKAQFRPADSPVNFTGTATGTEGQWRDASSIDDDARPRQDAITAFDARLLRQAVVLPLVAAPSVLVARDNTANVGPTRFAPLDWTAVGFTGE